MKVCKIRRTAAECSACMELADFCNSVPDCKRCEREAKECEIMSVGITALLGKGYAIVACRDEMRKVDIELLYDIHEV